MLRLYIFTKPVTLPYFLLTALDIYFSHFQNMRNGIQGYHYLNHIGWGKFTFKATQRTRLSVLLLADHHNKPPYGFIIRLRYSFITLNQCPYECETLNVLVEVTYQLLGWQHTWKLPSRKLIWMLRFELSAMDDIRLSLTKRLFYFIPKTVSRQPLNLASINRHDNIHSYFQERSTSALLRH